MVMLVLKRKIKDATSITKLPTDEIIDFGNKSKMDNLEPFEK